MFKSNLNEISTRSKSEEQISAQVNIKLLLLNNLMTIFQLHLRLNIN